MTSQSLDRIQDSAQSQVPMALMPARSGWRRSLSTGSGAPQSATPYSELARQMRVELPHGVALPLVDTEQADGRSTSAGTPPGLEVPLRSPLGRPKSLSPTEEERTPRKRRVKEVEYARGMVAVPMAESFDVENKLGQVMDEDAQFPDVAPEVQHRIQEGHVEADGISGMLKDVGLNLAVNLQP